MTDLAYLDGHHAIIGASDAGKTWTVTSQDRRRRDPAAEDASPDSPSGGASTPSLLRDRHDGGFRLMGDA